MLKTPQNSRDDRSFRRWFSPCARNSACTAEMGLGCKDVTLAGGECGEGGIRAAAMHILRAAAQRLPGARPCACLLVRPSPHCIARRRLRANHACVSFASLCLHPIPVSQRIGYERPRARNGVCAGFAPQLCTSCALRHSAFLALDPVLVFSSAPLRIPLRAALLRSGRIRRPAIALLAAQAHFKANGI
jgi:hypothetical protein